MKSVAVFALLQCIYGVLSAGFNVVPADVRMIEIAENVNEIKGAIMGIAEYVVEIRKSVNVMHTEVGHLQTAINSKYRAGNIVQLPRGQWVRTGSDVSVDEILRREELAKKLERLFRSENITQVEALKEELTSVVENNFLRMLAALVVTGPVQVQERTSEIFRVTRQLMKTVLNGQMDFKPVVERLPFLIRDSETNQFILLLKTLRETERVSNKRQLGGLEDVGKIVDALGQFDLREVSGFLSELPELFESIETIVDGVDEYL